MSDHNVDRPMTLTDSDRAVALAEQIYAALNHDRLDQMSHGAIDSVIADLNTLRSLVGRCSDINVAISSLERMKHPRANRLLKAQSAKEAAAGARNMVYDMAEAAQSRNMTRYKGRTSPKAIEREFPHVVEIAVPPRGLGVKLDAMHHFHGARGIQACIGLGRRDRGRGYLRWYFTRPAVANAFAAEFGGTEVKASR